MRIPSGAWDAIKAGQLILGVRIVLARVLIAVHKPIHWLDTRIEQWAADLLP